MSLIFSDLVHSQGFPFTFNLNHFSPDSITFASDKTDFEAFSLLSKDADGELFYFKGTTYPIPFSPVYRWNLFISKKDHIELSVTNKFGQPVTETFVDSLTSGLYQIQLDGLWDVKEPNHYTIYVKSKLKTVSINFFFIGKDNLLPPDDGLVINNLNSTHILEDSLYLKTTINKKTLAHLESWILNVPKTRQFTFQLFGQKDSLWYHYETRRLKPGLYEIIIDSSINSGKYRLEIGTYDAKLEEVFTLIR